MDPTLAIILLIGPGYALPWAIAILRGHPQAANIGILNLLLGWTVLGWIAALVWSATAMEKRE